jgi:hypothetical protein
MICFDVGMAFPLGWSVVSAFFGRKVTHHAHAGLAVSARKLIQINHDLG